MFTAEIVHGSYSRDLKGSRQRDAEHNLKCALGKFETTREQKIIRK